MSDVIILSIIVALGIGWAIAFVGYGSLALKMELELPFRIMEMAHARNKALLQGLIAGIEARKQK